MEISLTQSKFAIIDDEDFKKVKKYKWYASKGTSTFYARAKSGKLRMHRLIMNAKSHQKIDHINHNGLDNRKCNLRFCSQSQNMMNGKIRINNKSGYKGVHFDKFNNKWRAEITHNKKAIKLGRFVKKEDAAKAYDIAAKKIFKNFAKLNFFERGDSYLVL